MATKVLVYWPREKLWSVLSQAAVRGESMVGTYSQAKFQGKLYPCLIIAKDNPDTILKEEERFKDFLQACLMEEAAEEVEASIQKFIKAPRDASEKTTPLVTHSKQQENVTVITAPRDAPEKTTPLVTHSKQQENVTVITAPRDAPKKTTPLVTHSKQQENVTVITAPRDAPEKTTPLVTHSKQQENVTVITAPRDAPEKTTPLVTHSKQQENVTATLGDGDTNVVKAQMNLLNKPVTPQYSRLSQEQSKEFGVSRKEFIDLQEQVKRLKRKVRDLEDRHGPPTSPKVAATSSPKCTPESAPNTMEVDLFNGHSEDHLRSIIIHIESLYESCEKLLMALFSPEYIATHSVTGRRANTHTIPKPKMDERLYACFVRLIKEKFPGKKETEITNKVQAIQKKCKKTTMD